MSWTAVQIQTQTPFFAAYFSLNGFMNKVDVNGYIQQLWYTGNTQTNHMLWESFHVMLLSQSNNLFRVQVGKQKTPRGDERSQGSSKKRAVKAEMGYMGRKKKKRGNAEYKFSFFF